MWNWDAYAIIRREGRLWESESMLTNMSVPYDLCVGMPMSHLAFSVIVETDESLAALFKTGPGVYPLSTIHYPVICRARAGGCVGRMRCIIDAWHLAIFNCSLRAPTPIIVSLLSIHGTEHVHKYNSLVCWLSSKTVCTFLLPFYSSIHEHH